MSRKIVVYSTKTSKSTTIESSATTWGELRTEIRSLLTEDMTATVLQTKNQLVSSEALLPEGEFKLVLTPSKTKSGAVDVAAIMVELREKINCAFDELIDEIESGDFGQNEDGTTLSKEELAEIEKIKNGI